MAKNKMEDLQEHLFMAIEMVKSGELKPDAANSIVNLGRTLLDSAKVELKYMEVVGASRARTPLLGSVDGKATAAALPEPMITYRCNGCDWTGKQTDKLRNGDERVCPECKGSHFQRLINGRPEQG